jgi:hypothetical protein
MPSRLQSGRSSLQVAKDIVNYLSSQPGGGVETPSGNMLRPRTLQLLGLSGAVLSACQAVQSGVQLIPLRCATSLALKRKLNPLQTSNQAAHHVFQALVLRPLEATRSVFCAALASGGPGGGFERLHFMLTHALQFSGAEPELTPQFLKAFDAALPFDTNPLYAVLHEPCYSQGPATRWSAQRVRDQMFAKAFDAEARKTTRCDACSSRLCLLVNGDQGTEKLITVWTRW